MDGRDGNARRLQSNQIEKIGWRAPTGFLHKNSIVGRFKFFLLCAGPFIRCAVEMFVIQLGLGAELTKQATRKKQIAEIRDGTFATRKRDKIAGAKSRKVPKHEEVFETPKEGTFAKSGERKGRKREGVTVGEERRGG